MTKSHSNMSGPRWLTLIVSGAGLVLTLLLWLEIRSDPVQQSNLSLLFICLPPFVLGMAISVLPMSKRTRIMLHWLTATIMSMAGAITIFSGIGLYFFIAVIFFLVAAWMLNESGEPTLLHRQGDIITNPRTRPHA